MKSFTFPIRLLLPILLCLSSIFVAHSQNQLERFPRENSLISGKEHDQFNTSGGYQCFDGSVVVSRPENPTLHSDGPYFPGENIQLCYSVEFFTSQYGIFPPNGNNCAWIQGLIPVFYTGIDSKSAPTLKKGLTGWKWFEEGVVHYNEDNDNYSIITLPNGRKGLMYGSPKLNAGEALPAGWYFSSVGNGADCTNSKNPDQAWGLPTPCNQKTNLNFCFGIQISVAEDIANCSTEKVDVGLFVMADSETGCLHPATCEGAEPIRFSGALDCSYPVQVTFLSNDTICSGSGLDIEIIPFHPDAQISITAVDNLHVLGTKNVDAHIGNYNLQDTLINLTNEFQSITYYVKSVYDGVSINKYIQVTVAPDNAIAFSPQSTIISCTPSQCFEVNAFIIGENDPSANTWIGPNIVTENGITKLCPEVTTTYIANCTNAFGCNFTRDYTIHVINDASTCTSYPTIHLSESNTTITANNTCGTVSNICNENNESTIYFQLVSPPDFTGSLKVDVLGLKNGLIAQVDSSCSNFSRNCESSVTLDCSNPNRAFLIAVSSSAANAGVFQLIISPKLFPVIQGHTYVDLDASGDYGGIDSGLSGVPIELVTDCDGTGKIIATTISDSNGIYKFSGVPLGMYRVRVSEGAPGAPVHNPVPQDCCILIEDDQSTVAHECDLGWPPPNCTSNPYSVDNICEDAYFNPLCNLTVIEQWPCGQNPSELGPWAGKAHCNGKFENTSFYGFVAGEGNYQIEFTVFACAGTGVQYGIYEACEPNAGPICDGNANTGTITVDASQLTPCQKYVFWIDGYSGSVCSYYVHVTGDFIECRPPIVEDIVVDSKCSPLCPSISYKQTIKVVADPSLATISEVQYHWKITDPNGNVDAFEDNTMNLDYIFPEAGTYEICLQTHHPCPGFSDPICKTFEFKQLEDQYKEFKICSEDFPFDGVYDNNGKEILDAHENPWGWLGGPVTLSMVRNGNNRFSSPKVNKCGCPYIQTILIDTFPAGKIFYEFALCKEELPFVFLNNEFNSEVDSFKIINPASQFKCDSVSYLTIDILDLSGNIVQSPCINNGTEVKFVPSNFNMSFVDSVSIIWTNSSGDVVFESNDFDQTFNISADKKGLYYANISLYKLGHSCSFNFNEIIDCQVNTTQFNKNYKTVLVPNPSSRFVKVVHDQTGEIVALEIYDALGKFVKTKHNSFDKIIVEDFASGIYFFKVYFENGSIVTLPFTKI